MQENQTTTGKSQNRVRIVCQKGGGAIPSGQEKIDKTADYIFRGDSKRFAQT
jgi:hypothetical protein